MARWASLIDIRRSERPVILVDTGNFCYPRARRHSEFEDDFFFEGMRLIGYDAAGVGPNEIRYGRARLLERAGEAGFELLSANILDRRGEGTLGSPHIVRRAGGRRTIFGREGGVRVGIFAVTLPLYIYDVDRIARDYYEVIDPRIAALEAVSRLRGKGCDLIIAISLQEWQKSLSLAEEVPGIDIVLNGKRAHGSSWGETRSGALVVDTGLHRTSLTEVSIVWRDGRPVATVLDRGGEAKRMPGRPDLAELQRRYEREAKARGITIQ